MTFKKFVHSFVCLFVLCVNCDKDWAEVPQHTNGSVQMSDVSVNSV